MNKMANINVRWAFNFTKWQPTHSDLILATSCVQPEEKDRLAKFIFKKDFKSSLIGRLMMRKFVCEFTSQPYERIQFVRDSKGKPLLENSSLSVNFNVSHQGDFTVLAGTGGHTDLGVDVMKIESPRNRNLNDYFKTMHRIFSPSEWDMIRNQPSDALKLAMYCRHWCLKESYLKAVGVGITINLQDVSFRVHTESLSKTRVVSDTEVYFKGEKLNWVFQEMMLDDQHCVAIAFNNKNVEETPFLELNFNEILDKAVPLLPKDEGYCSDFLKKLD